MENMAIDNSQMMHEHKFLTCPSSQYCYCRYESFKKKTCFPQNEASNKNSPWNIKHNQLARTYRNQEVPLNLGIMISPV
jgi:hypothetical protein